MDNSSYNHTLRDRFHLGQSYLIFESQLWALWQLLIEHWSPSYKFNNFGGCHQAGGLVFTSDSAYKTLFWFAFLCLASLSVSIFFLNKKRVDFRKKARELKIQGKIDKDLNSKKYRLYYIEGLCELATSFLLLNLLILDQGDFGYCFGYDNGGIYG